YSSVGKGVKGRARFRPVSLGRGGPVAACQHGCRGRRPRASDPRRNAGLFPPTPLGKSTWKRRTRSIRGKQKLERCRPARIAGGENSLFSGIVKAGKNLCKVGE